MLFWYQGKSDPWSSGFEANPTRPRYAEHHRFDEPLGTNVAICFTKVLERKRSDWREASKNCSQTIFDSSGYFVCFCKWYSRYDGIMMVKYFYFSSTTSRNCIYIYTRAQLWRHLTWKKHLGLAEHFSVAVAVLEGVARDPGCFLLRYVQICKSIPDAPCIYRLSTYSTLGETWPRSRDMWVNIPYMERLRMF